MAVFIDGSGTYFKIPVARKPHTGGRRKVRTCGGTHGGVYMRRNVGRCVGTHNHASNSLQKLADSDMPA